MTKSYNYIPTHFIYSPLLFFLLIFMYQLIRCHTLSKLLSQIFLFRIYAPTVQTHHTILTPFSTRPASGSHKYPHPHNPQTNPPTTVPHTPQIPTQPQIPRPHTPQIPRPSSLHNHTQPHSLHRHTPTQPHRHHTDTHATPSPADVADAPDADVDAVAPTLTLTQPPFVPYLAI